MPSSNSSGMAKGEPMLKRRKCLVSALVLAFGVGTPAGAQTPSFMDAHPHQFMMMLEQGHFAGICVHNNLVMYVQERPEAGVRVPSYHAIYNMIAEVMFPTANPAAVCVAVTQIFVGTQHAINSLEP